jgi:hypothetical protein
MDKYNSTYKDILGIWYGLALCAYARKTNCNNCRTFFNFTTQDLKNPERKIKFLEKT